MYQECEKGCKEEKAILLMEIQARKQGTQLGLCSADFSVALTQLFASVRLTAETTVWFCEQR